MERRFSDKNTIKGLVLAAITAMIAAAAMWTWPPKRSLTLLSLAIVWGLIHSRMTPRPRRAFVSTLPNLKKTITETRYRTTTLSKIFAIITAFMGIFAVYQMILSGD